MTPTEIRFTALPNGVSVDTSVRISVFISHLVEDSGTIPDILKDWPAVADALQFSVDIRDGTGTLYGPGYLGRRVSRYEDGAPLEATSAASTAWSAIFPPTTSAVARVPPTVLGGIATYPSRATYDSLHMYHSQVAAASTQTDITTVISSIAANKVFAHSLQLLEAFHKPPAVSGTRKGADVFQEFHNRLTAVLQYPTVLRLLRLVIDLEIPNLKLSALPKNGSIAVYVSGVDTPGEAISQPMKTKLVYPWVGYAFDSGVRVFTLTGVDPYDVALLGSSRYYATGADVDGGGLTIQHHVMRAKASRRAALTALPGRRNKGLQVFDLLYAENLPAMSQFARDVYIAASNNPTACGTRPVLTAPIVDARVLHRGYRIDVQSSSEVGITRSLCLRTVSVRPLPTPTPRIEEAATVRGLSSAPSHFLLSSGENATFKCNQVLFRWTGWSLVVPSPRQQSTTLPAAMPFDVQVVSNPPLPSLRYGNTYHLRARGVDLAGNGCTAAQVDALKLDQTWIDAPFRRHDVVPPPTLEVGEDGKPSPETVVLRSTGGGADIEVLYAVAPVASFDTMVLSGVLDKLSNAGNDAVSEGLAGVKHFIDPATTGIVASIGWPAAPVPEVSPVTVEYKPKSTAELQRLLVEENKRILITCKPGSVLTLKASKRGKIDLQVPRGRVVEMILRSLIPPGRLLQLELYGIKPEQFLAYGLQYSTLASPLRLRVIHAIDKPLRAPAFGAGANVTPLVVQRVTNETAVHFRADEVSIDSESTGHLELHADWEEVSDQVSKDGKWPTRSQFSGSLGSVAIRFPVGHPLANLGSATETGSTGSSDTVHLAVTHDFGDSKARRITGACLIAISRFARYFPASPTNDPLRFALKSMGISVAVPASAAPPPPQIAYMVPTIGRSNISPFAAMPGRETEMWGLRVYLHRGWFARGDGEMLAAILASTDSDSNGVCQLGADPARGGDIVFNTFQGTSFRNGYNVPDVNRAGRINGTVEHLNIMAFPVLFDSTKNLLYADVVLRPQTNYRPFLRLALTRYQPNALDLAQLSSTVTADFIQMGPRRMLSIVRNSDKFEVTVVGPGTDQSQASTFRTQLVAISEHRGGLDEPWRFGELVLLSPDPMIAAIDQTWKGVILRLHGLRNRIVIEEREISVVQGKPAAGGHDQPALEDELQGRLVYTDSFEYF